MGRGPVGVDLREPDTGRIAQGTVQLNRARLLYRCKTEYIGDDGQVHQIDPIVDQVCFPYQYSWLIQTDPEHNVSLIIAKDFDKAYRSSKALMECTNMFTKALSGDPAYINSNLVAHNCVEYLNPVTAPDAYKERLAEGFVILEKIEHHVFLIKGGDK